MKKRVTYTEVTFHCDQCGKEELVKAQGEEKIVFPYENDWQYLYNVSVKVGKQGEQREWKDGHFCCASCMMRFLAWLVSDEYEDKPREENKIQKNEVPKA
jgi:hypothetical protein